MQTLLKFSYLILQKNASSEGYRKMITLSASAICESYMFQIFVNKHLWIWGCLNLNDCFRSLTCKALSWTDSSYLSRRLFIFIFSDQCLLFNAETSWGLWLSKEYKQKKVVDERKEKLNVSCKKMELHRCERQPNMYETNQTYAQI